MAIYLFAKSKKRKYILLSIFLVAAAMITSARIIFFLSLLSLFFSALIFLKSTKHRVVAVIAIALLSFFVYNYTPSIKQKFSQFNEIEHVGFDKGNHRGVSSRLGNIQASYELIKRNPFFGTGTGDLLDELLEEYDRMKFTMGYKYRYNPHNQYLSYLVRNGFIGGGICILILYLFPFYFVLRRNDVLLFGFMLLVLGVSLTESFLDVHKGITFYAFFMTFLLARYDLDFWGRTQKKL
ncbi:MAG: O-antigen ligase family protein [Bacteroidota bacterium]